MQKTVVFDTNFLLIPGQFKVDIFSELQRVCSFPYTLCILEESVKELEKLTGDKITAFKDRRAAKLGLQLLKAKGVRVIGSRKVFKSTDKAILEFAARKNKSAPSSAIVATQDRKLRDELVASNVPVIVLRQQKYLRFYKA